MQEWMHKWAWIIDSDTDNGIRILGDAQWACCCCQATEKKHISKKTSANFILFFWKYFSISTQRIGVSHNIIRW
jgi:hypothetical protein